MKCFRRPWTERGAHA